MCKGAGLLNEVLEIVSPSSKILRALFEVIKAIEPSFYSRILSSIVS
jgi:hypothetical protein